MLNILLGLLFLTIALVYTRYWEHNRPRSVTTNLERAANTGGFTGLGAACFTGVLATLSWQIWLLCIVLVVCIHFGCILSMR